MSETVQNKPARQMAGGAKATDECVIAIGKLPNLLVLLRLLAKADLSKEVESLCACLRRMLPVLPAAAADAVPRWPLALNSEEHPCNVRLSLAACHLQLLHRHSA